MWELQIWCWKTKMASLSRDLQDYLSKNNNKSRTFNFNDFKSENFTKWFSSGSSGVGGVAYEKVSTSENGSESWFTESSDSTTNSSWVPSLTKRQRIVGFTAFVVMGLLCMGLASLYIPFLLIKARKFALLYTLGSLFLVSSFSLLWGPVNHIKHLFSAARLPFTIIYFGTMLATIYFALMVQSTPLTVICAVGQVLALLWFVVSYIPGGQTGLKFFTKVFSSTVTSTVNKALPV